MTMVILEIVIVQVDSDNFIQRIGTKHFFSFSYQLPNLMNTIEDYKKCDKLECILDNLGDAMRRYPATPFVY